MVPLNKRCSSIWLMPLVEKDSYQDGVILEEIRREGAVFLYRNYRFLVEG